MFQYAAQICGAPQVCLLLEWPVCYFYWRYELLTVCVMTLRVSLMLSSLFTNSISFLIDRNMSFCPNLRVVCISIRKNFTTALESAESAKTYNLAELTVFFTEKCI